MRLIRKKIFSGELLAGMRLGQNIFDESGKILLAEGTLLRDSMVERIQKFDLETILIFVEESENSNSFETYRYDEASDTGEINDDEVEELVYETRIIMNESLKKFHFNEMVEFDKIMLIVSQLIDEILSNEFVTINLVKIKDTDSYLLEHSVNVCLLSIITGIYLGYGKSDLIKLGLGALLHDIGKTQIPENIVNKPEKLTIEEFNVMKKHTELGYLILSNTESISKESTDVILHHHERVDGGGYPKGISGDEIPEFSKIVSLADVFDATTSDRVYRDRIDPYTAVEYILGETDKKFDKQIVRVFLKLIGYYPVGLRVTLNSGEQGIVKKKNNKKPVVRVLLDENRRPVSGYYEIDLNKNPSVSINNFNMGKDPNE